MQTKGNCELVFCQKEDEIMSECEHGKKVKHTKKDSNMGIDECQ